MALLPGGGNPWHSRIVVMGEDGVSDGAELGWNWNPCTAGCDAWPYPAPYMQQLSTSWSPAIDLHCTGHAQLATGPTLLTTGGDDHSNSWGVPDALAFTPGSNGSPGTWSARRDMRQPRFYGTVTALRDGRMVAAGGVRETQDWHFGGRVNGSPPTGGAGDFLHRLGRGRKRIWDFPVTPVVEPSSIKPSPREGHTAAHFTYAGSDRRQAIFGGKDFGGITTDRDVYLLRREYGAQPDNDYKYEWLQLQVSGFRPPARSDHVAIDLGVNAPSSTSEMLIFGGLSNPSGGPTVVRDDLWRFYKSGANWVWEQIFVSGGPGPRYGHAAVKDGNTMYVFGGSAEPNQVPLDDRVYKYTLPNGPWVILPVSGTPSVPRRDHTMVLAGTTLLIYGGYTEIAPSSTELLRLQLPASPTGTAVWSTITTDGPSPGPRANHSARFDGELARMTIFGGERPTPGDPVVDSHIYSINYPFPASGNPAWTKGPATDYGLSGHAVGQDPTGGVLHAHLPEIYDSSGDTWTPQTASGWFPPSNVNGDYPVQFLVPGASIPGGGGRLLCVAPGLVTRHLDIPATGLSGAWVTNGVSPNRVLTGVQYAPGKIMALGGIPQGVVNDQSWTFDAAAGWVERPGRSPGHQDPDILVLPNGKVLVTGGGCTKIWDPTGSAWTSCLATEDISRTYHSTAILLPDGRVLAAGGDGEVPNVYSPPYLFEGNNLATRPTITGAPTSLGYGEPFVIATSDQIATACLIRPAAVTHSFDQNGRFVPLTFETLPNGGGLRAAALTDASVAPPGDYLLFILNVAGVPSIARWVHIANCPQVPCDVEPPPVVSDLYPDVITPNEIWLAWSAPGDDRNPALGVYDMRISASPISNENAFAAAAQVGAPVPPPTPGSLGSGQSCAKLDLAPSTLYHFALKTHDGAANRSTMASLSVSTFGGGGGGFSAERIDGDRQAGGASATLVAPSEDAIGPATVAGTVTDAQAAGLAAASSLDAGAGVLEAETRRTREGGWQVTLRRLAESQGVDAADRDAIVSQVRDATGGWRSLARYRPVPGQYPLGLCALRDNGRVVFPAGYSVDQVASGLRTRGQECTMSGASHSRSGSMSSSFVAEGGAVEMQVGDVLTVTYGPSGTRPGDEVSAYLRVRSIGQAAAPASATGRRLGAPLPTSFALHQNQPNPFDVNTTIGFDLPIAGALKLEVFDLLGRRVATLAEGEYPPGSHTVQWVLRGADGMQVRAGVYVYRLKSGTFSARRKLSIVP